MTDPDFELTGHGVVLRPWTDADLPAMAKLFDDPDIAYRTPLASPFDLAAADVYLRRARLTYATGKRIQLAITTDGGTPCGEVSVNRETRTIGYAIGAAHRGRGLAVGSVRLMTEYAHRELGITHLHAEIEPDNASSVAVVTAAGYRLLDQPASVVSDKGRSFELNTWVHTP